MLVRKENSHSQCWDMFLCPHDAGRHHGTVHVASVSCDNRSLAVIIFNKARVNDEHAMTTNSIVASFYIVIGVLTFHPWHSLGTPPQLSVELLSGRTDARSRTFAKYVP